MKKKKVYFLNLQNIQQNLIECIKVQNQSGTILIYWGSSTGTRWIYFPLKIRRYSSALTYGIKTKEKFISFKISVLIK